MSAMPSLLLAAFPPELAGLAAAPPAGWMVRTAGVGVIEAAVKTSLLLAELRPERVLFVGTCGAYDERLEIGAHLSAAEAVAVSGEELAGRAYRPEVERTRWPATWALPLPPFPVAVPPAITVDVESARRLAALAPAEHLELTGVFAACHAAGVPVAGALAVANRVGPGAHAEWRANHERVSRRLLEALAAGGVLGGR
jgi:purine-nucleoside phosphorylase